MPASFTTFDFIRGTHKPGWREQPYIAVALMALYVGLGVFVNLTIKHWPKVDISLPFSGNPPVQFPIFWGTVFVGLIFVLRDYGQRMFGDLIILWTLAAALLTYICIDRDVAVYSAGAFLVSEMLDQILFRWLGLTRLRDRILWSSLCSVWLDGVIILYGIDHLSWLNFFSHWTGKMAASVTIWLSLVMLDSRFSNANLNPAE